MITTGNPQALPIGKAPNVVFGDEIITTCPSGTGYGHATSAEIGCEDSKISEGELQHGKARKGMAASFPSSPLINL